MHPTYRGIFGVRSSNSSGPLVETIQLGGAGAPVGGVFGGQELGAAQSAVYFRDDGTISTFMYITVDGGTTWTAMDPTALATHDLNGTKLVLDADADTSITADTDDQIDIEIAGADDFQITANTFTALAGSVIATNTITETTAGTGVTIDGVLVKDYGIRRVAAGDTQDLVIALTGAHDASVLMSSTGTGTDAIGIAASAGGITMSSTAVASAWTHTATGAADDLTIALAGAVDASLVLSSAGTGADSLQVTASAGGMDITAAGDLDIVGTTTADFGDGTGAVHYDGAGALSLTGTTTVEIDGSGAVTVESSAGAISVGADAVAQPVNIATGAAARVISIGNAASNGCAIEAGVGAFSATADTTATMSAGGAASVVGAANVLIDSTGATHEINLDVGTDDSLTEVAIRNDTGTKLFRVLGSGPMLMSCCVIDMANAAHTLTWTGAGANETDISGNIWLVDPNGGAQTLTLPTEASSAGMVAFVTNTANAAEDLTIKDDAGGYTVVVVSQNESATIWCDGTVWYGHVSAET